MYLFLNIPIGIVLCGLLVFSCHNNCYAQFSSTDHLLNNSIRAKRSLDYNPSLYNYSNQNLIEVSGLNHYGIRSLNTLQLKGHVKNGKRNLFSVYVNWLQFESITHAEFRAGYQRKLFKNLSGGFESNIYHLKNNSPYDIVSYNLNVLLTLRINSNLLVSSRINKLVPLNANIETSLPSSIYMDIHHAINKSLLIWINLQKSINTVFNSNIGLHYSTQSIYFNLNILPQKRSLGYALGYIQDLKWTFEIGNEYHQQLGISTMTALSYLF